MINGNEEPSGSSGRLRSFFEIVDSQDTELAREIVRAFLSGQYPDNFTTALTFFNREADGKIIARNEIYTGPYTTYWWFGK